MCKTEWEKIIFGWIDDAILVDVWKLFWDAFQKYLETLEYSQNNLHKIN